MTKRNSRRARAFHGAAALCFAAIVLLAPRRACALVGAGVEGGLIKRSASEPGNLKLGFAWGAHADVSLIPLLAIGPYYMHYSLTGADKPNLLAGDAVFNVLGLRARLTLPIPGSTKPYAFVGLGYTWDNYTNDFELDRSGHFFETPLGVGIAHEALEIIRFSLDFALRPGFGFGGSVYDDEPTVQKPTGGWSLMLGFGLNL
jgi:opacity protein-like surface antigen